MSVDITSDSNDNIIKKKRIRLVLNKSDDFHDVRCSCGALLFKELKKSATADRVIEIKCRKCGTLYRN